MDGKKLLDQNQNLKNKRETIRVESDGIAKKTAKLKAAHLLGLASAIAGGHVPTETSVSRALKTRNGIAHAVHVSRETLNRAESNQPTSERARNRKAKRKARMRRRRRQGRWA